MRLRCGNPKQRKRSYDASSHTTSRADVAGRVIEREPKRDKQHRLDDVGSTDQVQRRT